MIAIHQVPALYQAHTEKRDRAMTHIAHMLTSFEPISLAEMESVSLLNRADTKYVLRVSQLHDALQHLADSYRVLQIDHARLSHYQTLYFDTSDFALFRQHHNGLRSRYKVRVREYVDTDLAFWEVKRKTNRQHTVKFRLPAPDVTTGFEAQIDEFIDAHVPIDAQELEPKLWNRFLRTTLVSKYRPERLTLDFNLEFGWADTVTALPGIAVAEVKQPRASQQSDFIQQMRRLGVRPARFSKYCTGICLLYDNVKTNNFKARMQLVDKLMQQKHIHEHVH